jgi:RimJ/RimL family protein N-acetyltransferase
MVLDIPTLETERLRLRAFRESDLDDVTRLNTDPAVVRYKHAPLPRPESWRSLAAHLGHWVLRGYGLWAVELHDGRFVGWAGLYHPEDWPDIELGWTIDPAFWGRGLAPEAAAAALDHAERTLGRRDLISVIQPNNRASIRVAEKLGGRPERRTTLRGIRVLIYRHGGAAQGPAGGRQRP